MRFNYKFSHLCGSVYTSGNVVFTSDGNTLLSPVGNRVSVFDLVNHVSTTLPIENRKNIRQLALSHDSRLLISVDEDGHALLINLRRRVVLHRFNFKKRVRAIEFSPDDRYVAVSHGKQVKVWNTPGLRREFSPFVLHRTFTGHYDDVISIKWSPDSQYFITGSRDMSARIYTLHPLKGWIVTSLAAHRERVVGAFFSPDMKRVYTVARDAACYVWAWNPPDEDALIEEEEEEEEEDEGEDADDEEEEEDSDEEGGEHEDDEDESERRRREHKRRKKGDGEGSSSSIAPRCIPGGSTWWLEHKHFFNMDHARVHCVALHNPPSNRAKLKALAEKPAEDEAAGDGSGGVGSGGGGLLVVGFSSGIFGIYTMDPAPVNIHTLSISQEQIHTVAINASSEWLAFGSARLGQLLVWEWQSETYVFKQQGHYGEPRAAAYSPDGQIVATGGDDAKVKLWSVSSGFCFVTFAEHTAAITDITFSGRSRHAWSANALLTSSLDGTVRAFDLSRYRNFRTLTAPKPTQFMCLACDAGGDIVCAGAMDPFDIYVWSLQTGRILDVLSGHEAPVSCLAFSTSGEPQLASSSWDHTVKLWDVYKSAAATETIETPSDVLAIAFRPDGKQVCGALLHGQLMLWNTEDGEVEATIEGRRDIGGGRNTTDMITSANANNGRCFDSLCYTADGTCIIAAGRSKYVCIYEISQQILLKRFTLTHNRSLEGVNRQLNSSKMTEEGVSIDAFDLGGGGTRGVGDWSDDELQAGAEDRMPGSKSNADPGARRKKLEVKCHCVRFSPTGRAWTAATTEGLMIYTLEQDLVFDPTDLDVMVTPQAVHKELQSRDPAYARALHMALQLHESPLIQQVRLERSIVCMLRVLVSVLPEKNRMMKFSITTTSSERVSDAHSSF
jgi:periodic tryptophan protein 2